MPVVTTIYGNEKAYLLIETNEQSPGSRGFHRYQKIYVIRDDHLALFQRDLGLAKDFKNLRGFQILGLLEESVDGLMDIAEDMRNDTIQDEIDIQELIGILK